MLKIHNSLTGEKEGFTPLRADEVRMYVCGMTVYDYIHVGHARMLTVFDLVQRHLMTMEWLIFASPDYLKRYGVPQRAEDLDAHKLVLFGDYRPPVSDINWLAEVGRRPGSPRRALLEVNNAQAVVHAIRSGIGIGVVSDFMLPEVQDLVRVHVTERPISIQGT